MIAASRARRSRSSSDPGRARCYLPRSPQKSHRRSTGASRMPGKPRPTGPVGLYDPTYEHDACGVAFVARLDGRPSHETVQRAVVALENLEHRGAAGADPNTGDGAGILLQMPDELMRGLVGPGPAAAGPLRRLRLLPAAGRRPPRRARGAARGDRRRRGPARDRLARRPGRQGLRRHHRQLLRAVHQAPGRRRRGRPRRGPGRLRAQALRDPPRGRDRRRAGARGARRSPRARSCTRECSRPRSCSGTTPTCRTPARSRRSRSSTRASRPTRSRAGSSRTRTG